MNPILLKWMMKDIAKEEPQKMGPEFFQTQMGRKFYEADVPTISRSLGKISKSLEVLIESMPETKAIDEAAMNALQQAEVAVNANYEALEEVKKIRKSWNDKYKGQGAVPYDEAKSVLLILIRILGRSFATQNGKKG